MHSLAACLAGLGYNLLKDMENHGKIQSLFDIKAHRFQKNLASILRRMGRAIWGSLSLYPSYAIDFSAVKNHAKQLQKFNLSVVSSSLDNPACRAKLTHHQHHQICPTAATTPAKPQPRPLLKAPSRKPAHLYAAATKD